MWFLSVPDPVGRSWFPVSARANYTTGWTNYAFHYHSGSFPQTQVSPIYFDREDVKRALHAPVNVTWTECSNVNVFPHGDASTPPALNGILSNVIEKSERAVIVHGLADFILIAEGWAVQHDAEDKWLMRSSISAPGVMVVCHWKCASLPSLTWWWSRL